tara:strand:- start:2206 stop:2514 length:309 start_codon:yes stop_codon:yes gene_type:complete
MATSDKKETILGDNLSIHINIKWLIQIIVVTGMITFGWYKLEIRIQELERNMELSLREIELHEEERQRALERQRKDMEEEVSLLRKELNINPFSWGKKKRSK